MNFEGSIGINIYSIIILSIIYVYSVKQTEKEDMSLKLYVTLVIVTAFMLVIDIFSRFDGKPNTIYPLINGCGNFMIFLLNLVIPSLWFLYVHYQVFHDKMKIRQWVYPLAALNFLNAVSVILSQFFSWFYYIDSENIYHRGRLFWIPTAITIGLVIASLVLIIAKRNNIEKKHFFSLIFFPIPPLACAVLQVVIYGIPLVLNGVVVSLLIVFIHIQNRSINIDFLTGVYNRKKLWIYMKKKIKASTEVRTFSAILLDLDDFKCINDTFGHDMGDYALEASVAVLKSCLKATDFIARFGGDEFCVVLDVSDMVELNAIVDGIRDSITLYNEQNNKPYKLGFSMGYALYDCHSHMNEQEFIKQLDVLMYKNKHANKEINDMIN